MARKHSYTEHHRRQAVRDRKRRPGSALTPAVLHTPEGDQRVRRRRWRLGRVLVRPETAMVAATDNLERFELRPVFALLDVENVRSFALLCDATSAVL